MIGIDLFFKGIASCFKMAEKGLDTTIKVMESFTNITRESKPSQEETAPEETSRGTPEQTPSEKEAVSSAREKTEVDAARAPEAKAPAEPPVEPPSPEKVTTQLSPKPASKAKRKPTQDKKSPKSSKVTQKAPSATVQAPTATDQVRDIILASQDGINTAEIREATGFEPKKIQNIVYKLKKKNIVKIKKKGVYIKA